MRDGKKFRTPVRNVSLKLGKNHEIINFWSACFEKRKHCLCVSNFFSCDSDRVVLLDSICCQADFKMQN